MGRENKMETIVRKISLKERRSKMTDDSSNIFKVIYIIFKSFTPISAKGISNQLDREFGVEMTTSNVCSITSKLFRRLGDVDQLGKTILVRRKILGTYHYQITHRYKLTTTPKEIYIKSYLGLEMEEELEEYIEEDIEEEFNDHDSMDTPDPEKSSTDININLNIKGKIDIVFSFEKMLDK